MYPPDKMPLPPWDAGLPAELATDKANALALPGPTR
jgi:hypothetical protein